MNDVMQIDSVCHNTIDNGDAITTMPASSATINSGAPPMVLTVNQQQATTSGAPVLKLVSPVEGGAPQLIKVVPASISPTEQINSTSTYTISDSSQTVSFPNTNTLAVVQKMNDSQVVEGATTTTTNQRVYSIVTPNQQKTQQQTTVVNVAKTVFNNGQQRVHTLATLPTNARVIPAVANAANPPKVQILSNVVVSKQNIVINKSSLQAQRQIISNITTQKTITSVPNQKTVVAETVAKNPIQQTQQQQQPQPQKIPTVVNVNVNNIVTKQPLINNTININQKSIKTVNSMNRQPITTQTPTPIVQTQKTVKTLSPGSPQPLGYVQQKSAGVKTLSPNMTNHYNKIQQPVKMMGQPPVGAGAGGAPRVGGIKTLNAKNLSLVNRGNNLPPKPNYIGKHASQAQKVQKTPGGMHVKNRGIPPQRQSPLSPKYNQKSVINNTHNSQSAYNQALSAQILQNMSGAPAKNYAHSPDHTLSEDIGEEVRPDFSPSLSYLYQVVMLDHNYGAPPPPLPSPPVNRAVNTQHSPVGNGGALNGALLAAAGREREREKEREEKLAAAAYYNTTTKQRHGRHGVGPQVSQPVPYTSPPIASQNDNRNSLTSNIPDDDAGSVISSDGGPNEDGDEGEETETAPEGEGDEDGVTRCICDFDHDDGYMISCDVCLSWQHVDCMGLDRNAIPEKYQCVRCQPRHVDRKHARSIQIRKREDFMNMGTLPRENIPSAGPIGSGSGNASDSSSDTSTAESTGEPHNTHYGRHSTGKVSLNNNFVGKKRGTPVSLSTRRKSEPATHNRRGPLAHKRQQRRESARESSVVAGRRTAAMKKREKKVKTIKRKMKSRSSIDDDSQDSWHGVANAYSNTMGASLMQLRQWIENYEEAVTNHYSPELRARISNIRANGSTNQQPDKQAPSTAQADVAVQKCKVSGQQLTGMKIVLASQTLTPNAPVIELRGKYMLSTQHRTSTGGGGAGGAGGLQTRQHSQRPGPFLFFYRLPRDGTEVCVDTRTYGNDARFIRRSCRPNAELRHLVEKGTLHLYVITISNVEKNSELTIKHESHDLAAVAAASSSANNPTQAIAAIAAAGIQCACGGSPQSCGLYNNRKNGGTVTETPNTTATTTTITTTANTENNTTHRKRRGRRASTPNRTESPAPPPPPPPPPPAIQPQTQPEPVNSPPPPIVESSPQPVEPVVSNVVAAPPPPPPPPALSTRRASSHQRAAAQVPPAVPVKGEHAPERDRDRERERERDRDREKEYREKDREELKKDPQEVKDKKKKMTREERKMEAIMKAIERMEKADQRKQELQARQAQRKDTDPSDPVHQPQKQQHTNKQENGDTEREAVRTRRKKRKGRARTISTNSQSSTRRRTRVNSTDSYVTSGDESLLSPPLPASVQEPQQEQRHTRSMTSQETNENTETIPRECLTPEPAIQNKIVNTPGSQASQVSQVSDISSPGQVNAAAGLLLALANGGAGNQPDIQKSPEADGNSSGSNSSLQSSPSTPLSSACLLVAAAVGPLEPGFKFPKTKKAIMNEWLNKSPDPIQSIEISNETIQQPVIEYYSSNSSANKSLATLVQAANLCDSPPQGTGGRNTTGQGAGNAKKRWLRQAISEECDSPCSRPESPPGSSEMVAPPKKRRLARESLSSEQSFTPPTTPTMLVPPSNSLADEDYPNNDEEFYTNEDRNATLSDGSPTGIEDPVVKDTPSQRVELNYNSTIITTGVEYQTSDSDPSSLLDPRLGRDPRPMFRDSAQLLGNIEKTIRFYEENLTGPVTVAPQSQPELPPPEPIIPPIIPSTIQLPVMETDNTVPEEQVEIVEEVIIPTPPVVPPDSPVPTPPIETAPVVVTPPPPPPQPKVSRVSIVSTPPKKEKIPVVKPEVITPTKRKVKLSISEYRQRKQLKVPADRSGNTTPERANSPETPPPPSVLTTSTSTIVNATTIITSNPTNPVKPRARSRSLSTSSTSSLSSDEEIVNSNIIPDTVEQKTSVAEPQVLVAFNSAPTAVERQRENVERLKKAFGLTLDDETRRSVLNNTTPTIRDEPVAPPKPPLTIKSPPHLPPVNNTLTTSDLLAKIEPSSTTKLMLSLDSPKYSEKKFSLDSSSSTSSKFSSSLVSVCKRARSPTPEKILAKNPSPEPELQIKKDKLMGENDIDDAYSKFDESVSTVYIPSFNNPVYPNSTQYTGFSSVIDTSPYEGRNPSPPPSELLKSTCYK